MRKLFTLIILGLSLGLQAQERMTEDNTQKAALPLQRLDAMARHQALSVSDGLQAVSMTAADPESVAASIRAAGYHASVVDKNRLTATVPASYLYHTLSNDSRINHVYGSHKMHFFMNNARADVGVETIRTSSEFETPFTGKGVLVAMIDGGFKYDHIAFQDSEGNSRVKMIWDRQGYKEGVKTEPTTIIPKGNDGNSDSGGHGTHTTGIAAGSILEQNDLSGIAPEADIIMISTSLEEAEVMEDLTFIDQYATEKGQPYVVNMSFGDITGSHDGKSPFDQHINQIATNGVGHALVLAAGNSGSSKVHVSHTFTSDDEKVCIALPAPKSKDEADLPIDLWGCTADGTYHLNVKAYSTTRTGTPTELSFNTDPQVMKEICEYNNTEHYQFNASPSKTHYSVFVINGHAGDSFDAWTTENGSFNSVNFTTMGIKSKEGDSMKSLGGSGSIAANAFCVANYITSTTINSLLLGPLNLTPLLNLPSIGDLSKQSSRGPTQDPSLLKPDVAAPGTIICAPIEFVTEDSEYGMLLVDVILNNGEPNYFMADTGTSMAAPMVSGTMALWLQANPNLSCDQLHEIVNTTARHDDFTGDSEWNADWGYGKLDAYNGLKKALELAESSGIPTVYGSEAPVSLKKSAGVWRVLFNNAEPHVTISIYDQQGRVLQSKSLTQMQRGQETTLNLGGLPSGIYIVKISTAKSNISRKLVVSE